MKNNIRAAVLAGGALLAASTAAATELTASIFLPDTHSLAKYGFVEWAPRVAEASGGDLTVQVLTGGALLPASAGLSGLRDGIADISQHPGTFTPSALPEDNTLNIIGVSLDDLVVITAAVGDFYMHDPEMQAMFKRNGIVFLSANATPPYLLICRDKIETLDDIKGKKIRVSAAIHTEFVKAVGAVPVNAPSTEMYTGLEKGQIDCTVQAADDLKGRSLWDVAKHVTMVDLGTYFSGWLHAANADSWRNLSADQRRIMLDTFPDTLVDTMANYTKLADGALAEAPEKGVEIHQPAADLQSALDSFKQKDAYAIAIALGKEQFNIEDPAALIARFNETYRKWQDLLSGIDRDDRAAMAKILADNLYSGVDEESYGLQ